ncbi:MAG: adenylyltransferase/cytidyltransferase family protein [Ruminococcus sp.]|nr:adenylyltransferase/cytidyltransferase family protein [Ruminococcus sp.]
MTVEEVVRNLPKALINWYEFEAGAESLFISGGHAACEALYEVLKDSGVKVAKVVLGELEDADTEKAEDVRSLRTERKKYDYIVAAGILERTTNPVELLMRLKTLLKDSGRLLLGTENRFAIRYFCGDKDVFSGHVFDGIDGYAKVSEERKKVVGGQAYAKSELEKMLLTAGFDNPQFYSVLPCLTRPQMILSENYLPKEPIEARIFPQYNSPETVFLGEEGLYRSLMDNHMFHQMANAFLIECSMDGQGAAVDQVTVQGDRSREEAMATIIRYKKSVVKKPLYPEGQKKIDVLAENDSYLKQHRVPMVEAHLEKNSYVMPYIEAVIATDYFRELLRDDRDTFIKELTQFRQLILDSSEHVPYEDVNWKQFEPGWENRKKDDPNIDKWEKLAFGTEEERQNIGIVLERGYVDMVSLNCFHTENGFLFFDQEFYLESFPANAIFIRTIDFIYRDSPQLEEIYPRDELLKYFQLYEYRDTWRKFANSFLIDLRNEKKLAVYHRLHRRNEKTVWANRHRMDYSQEEYERLFTNIFKGTEGRSIWLFGSGKYSEQFIRQFGRYCDIVGIVDNSQERWGNNLLGVEIYSPDVLLKAAVPFKVFICIKFFEDVLMQLKSMGIKNISVYDPQIDYERPVRLECRQENTKLKKYHIGYVAGVFDLFHIGHLNLLRRAKEQCDYLIVGVVTDEQVINAKKTRPYMAFEERLAIVQACRYVDEAVEIPADRPSTEDAYYMYHFDAQFSGSDYADDPYWHAKKVFLQQHGSDLVFFPYTESTSSTQIKELIGRKLL